MANDKNMMEDIDELLQEDNTEQKIQQGYDLNDLYFYRFIDPDPKKLEKLKKLYIKQYGFLDNYV